MKFPVNAVLTFEAIFNWNFSQWLVKWNILQVKFLFIGHVLWRIIKFNVVFAAELYLLEIVIDNKLIKYPPVESVYLYKHIICTYLDKKLLIIYRNIIQNKIMVSSTVLFYECSKNFYRRLLSHLNSNKMTEQSRKTEYVKQNISE